MRLWTSIFNQTLLMRFERPIRVAILPALPRFFGISSSFQKYLDHPGIHRKTCAFRSVVNCSVVRFFTEANRHPRLVFCCRHIQHGAIILAPLWGGHMARITDEERLFRMRALLCLRCGLQPRKIDRNLCSICSAEERTKMMNKLLTKLDRMWSKCEAA